MNTIQNAFVVSVLAALSLATAGCSMASSPEDARINVQTGLSTQITPPNVVITAEGEERTGTVTSGALTVGTRERAVVGNAAYVLGGTGAGVRGQRALGATELVRLAMTDAPADVTPPEAATQPAAPSDEATGTQGGAPIALGAPGEEPAAPGTEGCHYEIVFEDAEGGSFSGSLVLVCP